MDPVRLTKSTQIPSDVLTSRGLTQHQLEQQQKAPSTEPPQRTKGETADEKRARKQAVREMRKVSRSRYCCVQVMKYSVPLKHIHWVMWEREWSFDG